MDFGNLKLARYLTSAAVRKVAKEWTTCIIPSIIFDFHF